MADTKTLEDLKNVIEGTDTVSTITDSTVLPEPKIDDLGRAYATGKRKNSIARVWIKPGNGKSTVNGRDQGMYFARPVLRLIIAQAFQVAERVDSYDVVATVKGGGAVWTSWCCSSRYYKSINILRTFITEIFEGCWFYNSRLTRR